MQALELREADVLVVGGGLTGLYAAIRARQARPEGTVMLVDKATTGRSGCVAFAGGDITCVLPEDNLQEIVDIYSDQGQGLADKGFLQMALEETWPRVQDMIEWGVPFERTAGGTLLRKGGRGGGALSVVCEGRNILDYVRDVAQRLGVQFINRVAVFELLVEQGEVIGAAGLDVENGVPYIFRAGAVVLCPGPCSFKATYIGHRMVTGDGIAAAYRHGAIVTGMEFAVAHNTGPRDYDISGMARFVAMGGKFFNGQDEEFMWRYDPVLGNRANWGILLRAMASEVNQGRGPIYFDLSGISDEDYTLSRRILGHTFLALERAGIDIRRQRVEWVACFAGNRGSAAGLVLDRGMATTLPGLFTGGDTGTKPHYGANAGYHGMNLGWCVISGYHAGQAAAAHAAAAGRRAASRSVEEEAVEYICSPSRVTTGGLDPDALTLSMQEALFPAEVVILKERGRLQKALAEVKRLQGEAKKLTAADSHQLVKANEVRNMLLVAEMILRSSIAREESRGIHYREDFPQRDEQNWRRWIKLQQRGPEMALWTDGPEGPQLLGGEGR